MRFLNKLSARQKKTHGTQTHVSELLAASIIRAMIYRPDDGGSKHLRNAGKLLLPDYTALQPKRQPSSYSPP
jgi:hypothetical protein